MVDRYALKVLFPGSFDPPTLGHREVLRQACEVFGDVLVGLAADPGKVCLLAIDQRLRLLECLIRPFENARVIAYEELTAEFALKQHVAFLVRGLRNARDLAYERELAHGNEVLGHGLKTVFFLATGQNVPISSRMVRQVLRVGGLEAALPFVPEELHAELRAWWPQGRAAEEPSEP